MGDREIWGWGLGGGPGRGQFGPFWVPFWLPKPPGTPPRALVAPKMSPRTSPEGLFGAKSGPKEPSEGQTDAKKGPRKEQNHEKINPKKRSQKSDTKTSKKERAGGCTGHPSKLEIMVFL